MVLNKKKGLSPIVATVLLIALAIVLAMIIFLWARGWISEQVEKRGRPINQVCDDVKIRVDWRREGNNVYLVIVNLASIPVHAVEIRQEASGSSELGVWEINIPDFGTGEEKEVALSSGVTKLIVYPRLMGNVKGKQENQATTCLNSGEGINL